ncbi:MAG: TadE/TadG family type IV pilus assembly protein [Pirellulaceae bacterium]
MFSPRDKRACRRRGTTAVELAFILPVFFTLTFGLIHVCHAQMVEYVLKSACRNAARYGSAGTVSTAEVTARLEELLACAVDPSLVTVMVKNGDSMEDGENLPETTADYEALPNIELSTAEPRQLFIVRASVPYNSVSIISLPYCDQLTIVAEAIMRHE